MGLISRLFSVFFRSRGKGVVTYHQSDAHKAWKEKMKKIGGEIEYWLSQTLKVRGELPFSWEGGNDEAFLEFNDDNEAERDYFDYLVEYVMRKLDIPSAGEFRQDGSGSIYLKGETIMIKHNSVLKYMVDYDEKTDSEIYGEQEELDSGDQPLFE